MVERISWFSPADYEILLFFDACDIGATSKVVAYNIDYNDVYVNKRMRVLEDAGFFTNDNGIYELTDFGRAFLNGEVEVSEVEALDESE
ncbi:MarR family transcriptional regulator [Haloferax sp. MBLA0076]|uniref:MarR family transcriptional regulator n=1 Tax=Haloferax litoreum TaxID=2666140 RepID=A0A6A8GH32_9EURY|nr:MULTISPECIES: MarR family transcriptional regulator [Haloferax]KAB1193641.1 MarR family transcriptional regulator [Haloferax sp. CBA1148]MRX22169.1 MarR family transcriptional regulator [Haloferax litoreum]